MLPKRDQLQFTLNLRCISAQFKRPDMDACCNECLGFVECWDRMTQMTSPQHNPLKPRRRHNLVTRLWHWTNVIAVSVLFMSGLNIFNAHPRLYWGSYGTWGDAAWLQLDRFPGWMTIPGFYSLADARLWHVFFAWIFAISLMLYMAFSLLNRHVQRDLHVTAREWHPITIWANIRDHLRLKFAAHAGGYNVLQRLSYIAIIFVALPVMIFTGLAMSPAMAANWDWILTIFGGRQSARSIHFIIAWGLFAFLVLHVTLVLFTGPIKQMRGMITGGRSGEQA